MSALCVALIALNFCAPVPKNDSVGEGHELNTFLQAEVENAINLNQRFSKVERQADDNTHDITVLQIKLGQMDAIVRTLNHNIRRINKMEEHIHDLNMIVF